MSQIRYHVDAFLVANTRYCVTYLFEHNDDALAEGVFPVTQRRMFPMTMTSIRKRDGRVAPFDEE